MMLNIKTHYEHNATPPRLPPPPQTHTHTHHPHTLTLTLKNSCQKLATLPRIGNIEKSEEKKPADITSHSDADSCPAPVEIAVHSRIQIQTRCGQCSIFHVNSCVVEIQDWTRNSGDNRNNAECNTSFQEQYSDWSHALSEGRGG